MTDKEVENFLIAISKFDNICVSIDLYCDLLKEPWMYMVSVVTDREIIKTGQYATLYGTKIWVGKIATMKDGCHYIRGSNREELNSRDLQFWSPLLKLEDFERLFKLRAFW